MNHPTKTTLYPHCYWKANGELHCQEVTVPTINETSVDFQSFQTPTSNYQPNQYRQEISHYEKPHAHCPFECDKKDCPSVPSTPRWIPPPQRHDRNPPFQ